MSSAPSGDRPRGRIASFILDDHRYVLLGTSVVALAGMLLSSQPRPSMSFLANVFTVELAMYYALAAWLVVSAVALVFKLTHWRTYAETAPFAKPAVRRALRYASYAMWAITLVLVVDRVVMGVASAWSAAMAAESRPADDMLQSMCYILWNGRDTFATGLATTIELAVFGTVFAFFLALLLVFCRIQTVDRPDNDFVRFLKVVGSGFAKVYSTVVRGTPMMAQAMFIYYGLFPLLNINMTMLKAAIFILSINTGAYMAETVRGGILSIDPGQTEGAKSIGMTHVQTMIYVILPQALRNIMPQIGNNLIINIKDSCVLSVIGLAELLYKTKAAAGALYMNFETYTITMIMYFIMTFTCSRILRRLENKMDGPDNYDLATTDTLAYTSGMMRFPDEKKEES